MKRNWTVLPGLLVLSSAGACGESQADPSASLPTTPPTKVEMVTSEGFERAGAVAASPDGKTFYVAAYDDTGAPAVFAVSPEDASVRALASGAPLLYPSDLSVSCDGAKLFVSDMGFGTQLDELGDVDDDSDEVDAGAIHVVDTRSGAISELTATGILRAAGLIVSVDCGTLYVTGWTDEAMPAVFTVPVEGGAARVLYQGDPLVSPTGIHVDADRIAWVMDHLARGESGEGALFAIPDDGGISEVASGLAMGRHGGVSLTPGGTTAVIPVQDEAGSRLITANTVTGEVAVMPTPDISSPAGVAAAREAPVMVVAGDDSINIATFDE